jgi:hypothetical protein
MAGIRLHRFGATHAWYTLPERLAISLRRRNKMTAAVFHNLRNDSAGNLLPLRPCPRFRRFSTPNRQFAKFIVFVLFVALFAFQATAQNPPPPPPPPPPAVPTAPPTPEPGQTLTSKQLENLVSRIALYPDPLLVQILTASTFWHGDSSRLRLGRTSTAISRGMPWQMQSAPTTCNGTRAYWRCSHSRRS